MLRFLGALYRIAADNKRGLCSGPDFEQDVAIANHVPQSAKEELDNSYTLLQLASGVIISRSQSFHLCHVKNLVHTFLYLFTTLFSHFFSKFLYPNFNMLFPKVLYLVYNLISKEFLFSGFFIAKMAFEIYRLFLQSYDFYFFNCL